MAFILKNSKPAKKKQPIYPQQPPPQIKVLKYKLNSEDIKIIRFEQSSFVLDQIQADKPKVRTIDLKHAVF